MAITDIVDFIGNRNIAEDLEEDQLLEIGQNVHLRFEQDRDSMDEWVDAVEEGQKLIKQEFKPKSTPWDGAANFKSPLLMDASITFGDRAGLELMRSRNLVKADVIGRDEGNAKQQRADRITEAMNYQINHEMREWRKDQKRLFYTLPNFGTMFKKTIFDPLLGRNISHVIHYPDFVVNQATTHAETARSFTHILDVDQNKLIERQRSGLWLDVDIYPENSEGDAGSNEDEEVTDAANNPNAFLEQHCFVDLDDDGYEEPYIVTIHQQTRKVVRIVARYDENSIIVNQNDAILTLQEAVQANADQLLAQAQQTGIAPKIPEEPDFKGMELVRIEPNSQITKYGFIPSTDGTYLDLGYFHLLGAITMGINTTTNQLLDAGTLANRQGGLLAKGFRKKMGPISFRPGEWKSTEVSAQDLQQSMLPLPIKEPSQVLFALNEKLEQQGRQSAIVADAITQIQANTAPTTALAIIQEALIPSSAIMGRIIDAESEEFQKLFQLNQKFFDPRLYQIILDDPQADFRTDFNAEDFDIAPTASAEMASKTQRIQLSEVELSQFDRVLQAGGNPLPILRNFYDRIGSDVSEIFPEPGQMSPQDQQRVEQLQAAQEQANVLQQQQNELQSLQVQLLTRAEDRRDREADDKTRLQEQEQIIKAQQAEDKAEMEAVKLVMAQQSEILDQLKTQAETLKILREAQGVDVIVGPHTQEAYIQQAEIITESQDAISATPETDEFTRS